MPTARQRRWQDAAKSSDGVARALFTLIAQPNAQEREHDCREHTGGFRTKDGRRGIHCRYCHGMKRPSLIRWIDPPTTDVTE